MSARVWGPIRALGGAALIALAIALLFPILRDAVIDADAQRSVLVQAVPFVAVFVAVLLLYALVIVLVVRHYNGRIPNRAHSPILGVCMAGIVGGVIMLFQPFHIVGYRFGFVLLLISTLAFILWSHVLPKSARLDASLPPIPRMAQIAGAVAGLLVLGVLAGALISANVPQEPYGERQRAWDRYDEARKADIAARANSEFVSIEIPFLLLLSAFPGALVYFAVREVTAPLFTRTPPEALAFAPARRSQR
jgi:heme A synthase